VTTIWLTGLPCSGKSSTARALVDALRPGRRSGPQQGAEERGIAVTRAWPVVSSESRSEPLRAYGLTAESGLAPVVWLDGDDLRRGLGAGLGYGRADRDENVRRAGEVAVLLGLVGQIVVVSLVSPYQAARDKVAARHEEAGVSFFLVYLRTPPELCEARDDRGLYARARRGEIAGFTGVSDPYEPPGDAAVVLSGDEGCPGELAAIVLDRLGDLVVTRPQDRCS